MFKVSTLASSNQGFRSWPVETKMPDSRIVVDCFPPRHSREKSVHHNQSFGFHRELRRVGISHHQTDVVPHHPGLLDSKRTCQVMNADRGSLHVQSTRRN